MKIPYRGQYLIPMIQNGKKVKIVQLGVYAFKAIVPPDPPIPEANSNIMYLGNLINEFGSGRNIMFLGHMITPTTIPNSNIMYFSDMLKTAVGTPDTFDFGEVEVGTHSEWLALSIEFTGFAFESEVWITVPWYFVAYQFPDYQGINFRILMTVGDPQVRTFLLKFTPVANGVLSGNITLSGDINAVIGTVTGTGIGGS